MGPSIKKAEELQSEDPSSALVAKEIQADVVLDQIQSMQCQTLAKFGDLYPLEVAGKGQFEKKGLEDFVIQERTLALQDGYTYFFSAELKETSQEYGLMVSIET